MAKILGVLRETTLDTGLLMLIYIKIYVIIISSHSSIYAAVITGRPGRSFISALLFEAIIRK